MNISRRDLLKGSGAAALITMTAQIRNRPIIVGANATFIQAVHNAVPPARGTRQYRDMVNDIPTAWPGISFADGQEAVSLLSVRPLPADLLAGKLDGQLAAMIASAPPRASLTAWHEAGNLPSYRDLPYINASTMRDVHHHMKGLCAGSNVGYGVIMCMPPSSMPPWLIPGCSWYGLDIYDWPSFHFGGTYSGALDVSGRLYTRLHDWKLVMRQVSGQRYPKLVIGETNSKFPLARAKWFTAVGDWLSMNYGFRMYTFWSNQPDTVGPWTGQPGVISALETLAT